MLLTDAGQRIETTVSSPIAQVTRLAATEVARSGARHAGLALGVVRIAERAAERTARAVDGVFGQIRLRQDDRAGVAQSLDERRIVRRTIVGVLRIGAGRRAHVEGVVLILDRHHDAVQRPDELAGLA